MSTNKAKCHVCDRVFRKTEHLIRHKRSHTGERPYVCYICGRCFARSDVLSRHQKIHPRNRSYNLSTNVAEDGTDAIASTDKMLVPSEGLAHPSTLDGTNLFEQPITKLSASPQCPSTERTQGIDVQTLWRNSVENQSRQNNNIYAEADQSMPQIEDLMNQASGESTASTCSSSNLYQTSPDGEASISTVITPDFTDISYLDFGTPDYPLIGTSPRTVADFLSTNNNPFLAQNKLIDDCPNISGSTRLAYGQNDNTHINALSEGACFGLGPEHNMEWLFATDLLDYESSSNAIPWSSGPPPGRNGTHEKLLSISDGEIWPSEASNLMPQSFTQRAENFRRSSRMARLEPCWSIGRIITSKLMPGLWANLISDDSPNIFSDSSIKLRNTELRAKPFFSRWGFDGTCRDRLENHFGSPAFKFPSAKDLNKALDLFFRHYHILVPFIHLPTFSASSSPSLTLLTMCLIGLHVLNTADFNSFIHEMLPAVLDEVRSEVESTACGTDSATTMMRKFGTAFLALSLASMTGKENGQEKSMLDLYLCVISLAQRNGCFDTDYSFEVDLLHQNPDSDAKWKAWAKVESAKRILVTLLMADSWFAGYHHTVPAIRTDRFQMLLPCNEQLFRAQSPAKWSSIQQERHPVPTRRVQLGSNTRSLPNIHGWHDSFEITALLNSINICILEEYNLPRSPTSTFTSQQKPQKKDRSTDLVLEALHLYGNSILGSLNYNCAVQWNHMCIELTTDLRIFEAAARQTGLDESCEALKSIKCWSQTPQARRACLHAVQILRITSERYVSDGIMFPTITALFSSALVLGLYLLTVPDPQIENVENVEFDMLEYINWECIQGEGLPCADPNQLPMSNDPDDPALGFIRNGGSVCIGGSIYPPGYQSARQVFLEFACLSEEIAKWNVGNFFQTLRAMSDAFVEVEL